ncbi:MAG: UDP-N-acetylmuramoyl-tripeptide--D-alanyl-D-alanine ligase [Bacteroidales bacterium]|nr:UDP-N-acetylmuramoyl-tripeptide--D-alanyl-D-alanine ligase [Bacteroidales bacterium]
MDIQKLYSLFKECGKVTTDSRVIEGGELFFALKGENFDGNEYALAALGKGARYAVVEEGTAAAASGDERIIPVPDTLEALQALARHHRENTFVNGRRLTVIGLTGTNGKTTTKELVTRVLSSKYRVTSTRGNLNNDIGVPLSLLTIDEKTELAVIEMGANHPDDISKLVAVCEPDYGLITNVGRAHLLGFGSFEGVKRAKGQLYDYLAAHGGKAFVNTDDPDLLDMASGRWPSAPVILSEAKDLPVIPYSLSLLRAKVLPSSADHPYLRMRLPGGQFVETHLAGAYNATNVAAAIAVGLHFGVSLDDAVKAVGEYVPKNNRSQMEKTGRNILIEDAYNANPSSMAAALDNLVQVEAGRKAAMLGDMRELGEESLAEHRKVLAQVLSMGLDLVCLVGEEFRKALAGKEKDNVFWFATSDELAAWLKDNPVSGATILVKGSRGIRMEKALPEL